MDIVVQPIGYVRGGRVEAADDGWDAETAAIELDPARVDASATTGLEEFSHIEVVFSFHQVDESSIVSGARRPRGRTDWPEVGILAQRGKVRPNRLGVTRCHLVGVDGLRLTVRGLDAIDGTPVLDVKPHMTGFDAQGPVREPAWAQEIMAAYW